MRWKDPVVDKPPMRYHPAVGMVPDGNFDMRKTLLMITAALGFTALSTPVLACAMHETAQTPADSSLAQGKTTTTTKPTKGDS